MEIIKRKILLENYTDRDENSNTYGLVTASTFYVNFLLNQKIDDMGIFTDVDVANEIKGGTERLASIIGDNPDVRYANSTAQDYYSLVHPVITAMTESKLEDAKTYKKTDPYIINFDTNTETYTNYDNLTINGVNRITSLDINKITYVFDANKNDTNIGTELQANGLVFTDDTSRNTTKMSYVSEGWNRTNIGLSGITKEEYLFGIISKPETKSDVFIDRGNATVFDKHLKLLEITNIDELERYGNGFYKLNKQ